MAFSSQLEPNITTKCWTWISVACERPCLLIDSHRSLSMSFIFYRSGELWLIFLRAKSPLRVSVSITLKRMCLSWLMIWNLSLSLGPSKLNYIEIILLISIQLQRTYSAVVVWSKKEIYYRLLNGPRIVRKTQEETLSWGGRHWDKFPKPCCPAELLKELLLWSGSCFC